MNSTVHEINERFNRRLSTIDGLKEGKENKEYIRELNLYLDVFMAEQIELLKSYGKELTEEQGYEVYKAGEAAAVCYSLLLSANGTVPPITEEWKSHVNETFENLGMSPGSFCLYRSAAIVMKFDGTRPEQDNREYEDVFVYSGGILTYEILNAMIDILKHSKGNVPK